MKNEKQGIKSKQRRKLNSDLSTWEKQIEEAISKGQLPEPCIWGNTLTQKEEKEWTWDYPLDE